MNDQKVPYWQSHDWDGDGDVDADDARVYLSQHLLIRLTDTDKNPLPKAKCRIIGDAKSLIECDECGVAHMPLPDGNPPGIDLEWEPAGAPNQFNFKGSFDLNVNTKNDAECTARLNNLGFYGNTPVEQVNAYQSYFYRTPTGDLNNIRDEMVGWHDGGNYPGQDVSINADQLKARLKDAFSGIGTDEEAVICALNNAQGKMSTLVNIYPELENELYSEFSGDELKEVLHLFYEVSFPPVSTETVIDDPQWVSRLYDAFNSGGILGGTDEDDIMNVLQAAKNANQITELTNLYNKLHSDELTLDDELYDELSGDELRAALQIYYSGFVKNKEPRQSYGSVIKIDGTLAPADPSMPFTPRYPLPEKRLVEIEVTLLDYDLNPMPEAKWRLADKPDEIHISDASGTIKIPVQNGTKTIELEWEPKDADTLEEGLHFYLCQTFMVNFEGNDNVALSNQLNNLGFAGEDLIAQVHAYQQFIGRDIDDEVEKVRGELGTWMADDVSPLSYA